MKKIFRFLHISDLHLSKIHPLCPKDATSEKTSLFYNLSLQALKNSVSLVNQQGLDALIIAGDLFEASMIEHRVLQEAFDVLSDCSAQVIIAPGNHDLYSMTYNKERLNFYGIECPENVYIFGSPTFSHIKVKEANLYGMANTTRDIKPFDELPLINHQDINIAVFHGSLLSFLPEGKEVWLPFTERELIDAGFDYVALGHYHSYSEIKDREETIRAIYPGSVSPAGINEKGIRGGVVVEVEKSDEGSVVNAEFIELSEIKVKELTITITNEHTTEEIERMLLSETTETPGSKTVLYVKVEGSGQSDLQRIVENISEQFLHVEIDTSGLLSEDIDILISLHNPETTVGRFIRAIKEEMKRTDEQGIPILRNALLYGLDALRGKEIEPRYEDRKTQG